MGYKVKCPDNGTDAYVPILAHPSFDVWGYGVVLYHLCANRTLLHFDGQDNIEEADMERLCNWSEDSLCSTSSFKFAQLSKIQNHLARNLVSQLLAGDSERRPSIDRVLSHPFLTGKAPTRLPGQEAKYDVFLSYRVATDAAYTTVLYNALTARGLRVYWDKVCLKSGLPWDEGFCEGLVQSAVFVPVLTRGTLRNACDLNANSLCDNVLLEYRLALELRKLGLKDYICPVMIGDVVDKALSDEEEFTHYFDSGCHPENLSATHVIALEEKLIRLMDQCGLGLPLQQNVSVRQIVGDILINQGCFVSGPAGAAFDAVVDSIMAVVPNTPGKLCTTSTEHDAATLGGEMHDAEELEGRPCIGDGKDSASSIMEEEEEICQEATVSIEDVKVEKV